MYPYFYFVAFFVVSYKEHIAKSANKCERQCPIRTFVFFIIFFHYIAILNPEQFWNLFFIGLNLELIDCEQN